MMNPLYNQLKMFKFEIHGHTSSPGSFEWSQVVCVVSTQVRFESQITSSLEYVPFNFCQSLVYEMKNVLYESSIKISKLIFQNVFDILNFVQRIKLLYFAKQSEKVFEVLNKL